MTISIVVSNTYCVVFFLLLRLVYPRCCQFLWIIHCWLPLWCSLTLIDKLVAPYVPIVDQYVIYLTNIRRRYFNSWTSVVSLLVCFSPPVRYIMCSIPANKYTSKVPHNLFMSILRPLILAWRLISFFDLRIMITPLASSNSSYYEIY
jgi:hypothetical protein